MSKKINSNFLSVAEYIRSHHIGPNTIDYLELIANPSYKTRRGAKIIKVGMLKWNNTDSSNCLYGAFLGDYIFCLITDESKKNDLKRRDNIEADLIKQSGLFVSNIPRDILLKAFGQTTTAWRLDNNNALLFSQSQLDDILRCMTNNELAEYKRIVKRRVDVLLQDSKLITPSREYPFCMFLSCNNDHSFTKVFPDKKSAMGCLNYIIECQPHIQYLYDNFGYTG